MVLYYSKSVNNVSRKNPYIPEEVITEAQDLSMLAALSDISSNASMRFSNYYTGRENNEIENEIENETNLPPLSSLPPPPSPMDLSTPIPMNIPVDTTQSEKIGSNINKARYDIIMKRLDKLEDYLLILLVIMAIIAFKLFN
tara:strand:+ start:10060 stop:10485 length:426 start_codon:yes stop_codon:yes gene_type:complete